MQPQSPWPEPPHYCPADLQSTSLWCWVWDPPSQSILLVDAQLEIPKTEQCPQLTASHSWSFCATTLWIGTLTNSFARLLLVVSNQCEAVLHRCSLKRIHHHHHLLHTFTFIQPQAAASKNNKTKNKTHILYSNTFQYKLLKFKNRIMQPQSWSPEPMPLHCCPANLESTCPWCWTSSHQGKAPHRLYLQFVGPRTGKRPPLKASHLS